MPLTHDMGLIGFHLTPLFEDVDHWLMPTSLFVRRPGLWLAKASEHRVTVTCSPNSATCITCARTIRSAWRHSICRGCA
jgi:acyl-CoA synthetase (AMP-forming)/AMP-acid ligase II